MIITSALSPCHLHLGSGLAPSSDPNNAPLHTRSPWSGVSEQSPALYSSDLHTWFEHSVRHLKNSGNENEETYGGFNKKVGRKWICGLATSWAKLGWDTIILVPLTIYKFRSMSWMVLYFHLDILSLKL
jgi:hypothetical protein